MARQFFFFFQDLLRISAFCILSPCPLNAICHTRYYYTSNDSTHFKCLWVEESFCFLVFKTKFLCEALALLELTL